MLFLEFLKQILSIKRNIDMKNFEQVINDIDISQEDYKNICLQFQTWQLQLQNINHQPLGIYQISANISKEYFDFQWINEKDLEVYYFEITEICQVNQQQTPSFQETIQNIDQILKNQKKGISTEKFQSFMKLQFQQSFLWQKQQNCSISLSSNLAISTSDQKFNQNNNDKKSEISKQSQMDFMNSDSSFNYLNIILSQLKVPIVVKTLYFFYLITILTFITLLIFYLFNTKNFVEKYKQNYQILIFRQQIMIPLNSLYSYFNYIVIQNQNNNTISQYKQDFIDKQILFYFDELKQNIYQIYNLDESLNSTKMIDHLQLQYFQLFKSFIFLYLDNIYISDVQFLEFTKLTLQEILSLTLQIYNIQNFDNYSMYFLLKNNPEFIMKIQSYFQFIGVEINLIFNNFYELNFSSFILVIFIVVFSLVLNIPAYLSYKSKLQRLLLITTRINQREAESQIAIMTYIYNIVTDPDEHYLETPLNPKVWLLETRNLQIDQNFQQLENIEQQSSQKSQKSVKSDQQKDKKIKSKKHHAQSRIALQKLNTINFIVLIFMIAVFSCTFFFGIYYQNIELFYYLKDQLPLFTQFNSNAYYLSELLMLDQILIYTVVLQQQNIQQPQFILDKTQEQFLNIKKQDISKVKQFYFDDYINILINGQTNSDLKDLLQNINQNSVCDQLDFTTGRLYQMEQTCKSINNGILTRGILPTINQQIVQIENNQNDIQTVGNLKDYVQSDQLFQQLQTNEFLLSDLQKLSKIMLNFNENNTNQYIITIISIFTFLVIFKLSIFRLFFQFYFKKLESDYLKVFQSLRLIPFSKFRDETLRNLIKKSII